MERQRVLAFRARASHLDTKLGVESLSTAAAGGLQDSAPRAAVISLHARVRDVGPSSWEDPSLVQIWGPRGADYVVPRADVSVFTRGRLPRDAQLRRALEDIADNVLRVLDGQTKPTREVFAALPQHGHFVRSAAITGRVHIRWDASKIWAIPVETPNGDPETDRRELARRFLAWFGPTTRERFAWWSGVDEADARTTWTALGSELVDIDFDGEARHLLVTDIDLLVGAAPVHGVRLIPHSDPFIKIDGKHLVQDPERRLEVFPVSGKRTSFWPVAGAVVVDGEIKGSWARQQRCVTVNPWTSLSENVRESVEREALSFPIASRSKPSVVWSR